MFACYENTLLHTPFASSNLLSVYRLCVDNKVLIEFYSDMFYVRDFITKKVLLQGNIDNGLYKVLEGAQKLPHGASTIGSILSAYSTSISTSDPKNLQE